MDRRWMPPYSSTTRKGEYLPPSSAAPNQIPPLNYPIPSIHLSASNSMNNNISASGPTPELAILGQYPSAGEERKFQEPVPQIGNVAQPLHHYVLLSRPYQDPAVYSNSGYNVAPLFAQQGGQYFTRIEEPRPPQYTDVQLRQQVLPRHDHRQQYMGYSSPADPRSNLNSNYYNFPSNTFAADNPGVVNYVPQTAPNYVPAPQSLPQIRTDNVGKSPDENTETNFKPTQTKKNSRPKINKLESDYKHSLQSSAEGVDEHSHDKMYENFRTILGISTPRVDINKMCEIKLNSPLEKKLFDLFCKDIAGFIDIFLTYDYFEKIVSELAIYDETRMMLDSLLCLSSLIFQRKYPQEIDPWCPLKYYQRSVNSIRHNLSLPEIDSPESGLLARCLISTNILCIYELFFIAIDSTYVKGAGSILISVLSRGTFTKSLLKDSHFYQSCFWATYVCDLILSLKLELPNIFSTSEVWKPLDPIYFNTFEVYPSEDFHMSKQVDYSSYVVLNEKKIWWSHKIILLCGDINEFSNLTEVITQKDYDSNSRFYTWLQLSSKLNEFVKNMPVFLKPLVHKPAQQESEFPTIYFDDERTAIIAINLKISKILLYFALEKLRIQDESLIKPEILKFPSNHGEKLAIDIAGIMQTYDSSLKVWPVSIHSLRQASKFIHPKSLCHQNMKKLVKKVIQVCQTRLEFLTS